MHGLPSVYPWRGCGRLRFADGGVAEPGGYRCRPPSEGPHVLVVAARDYAQHETHGAPGRRVEDEPQLDPRVGKVRVRARAPVAHVCPTVATPSHSASLLSHHAKVPLSSSLLATTWRSSDRPVPLGGGTTSMPWSVARSNHVGVVELGMVAQSTAAKKGCDRSSWCARLRAASGARLRALPLCYR